MRDRDLDRVGWGVGKHSWVTAGGRGASLSKKVGEGEVGPPWGHSLVAVKGERSLSCHP